MASNGTISIGWKIETGKDGLKHLIVDAKGLQIALDGVVAESKQLNNSFVNFAAIATGIDSVSNTLSSLQAKTKEYSDAYRAQVEVERQLEQVMRNTMDARDEDIQSIKDFCSAQQQIGVIGDEVQLAGAQELATYLELKSSLKGLIPVMNDMLAQQYGYNATQENAAQIATMLGKVMEGQTGALSRYGYKFDEAQEKILKYGSESERVATLVDVVSSSVGGMNRQLAQTRTGQMKQLENTLGDIKEKIGEYATAIEPIITLSAGAMIALGSIIKLKNAVVVTSQSITSFKVVTIATDKAMKALGITSKFTEKCIKGVIASTGVGLVIWGLIEAVEYFTSSTNDASDSVDKLTDAQERAKRAAEMTEEVIEAEADARKNALSTLELYKSKLENFNGTKTEEKKIVDELNNTYGDTMGYFSSVAEWYQALIKNSEAYCRQMVAEAKARKLADQVAELELNREKIVRNEDGSQKKYTKRRTQLKKGMSGQARMFTYDDYEESDLEKAQKSYDDLTAQIHNAKDQLQAVSKEAASITLPVIGSKTKPDTGGEKDSKKDKPVYTETPKNLKQIGDNKTILRERLQTASLEEAADINRQIENLDALEKKYQEAGKSVSYRPDASNLKEYEDNIRYLDEQIATASVERAAELNREKRHWQELVDVIRDAGNITYRPDASNLKEYEENVRYLDEQIATASIERVAELNREKKQWQGLIETTRNAGLNNEKVFNDQASTLAGIEDNIAILQERLRKASFEEAAAINQEIKLWNTKADAIRNAGLEAKSAFGIFQQGWGTVKGLTGGIENLTSTLSGDADAWTKITGIVDGFIQIYEGISSVIAILEGLSVITQANAAAKEGEAAATAAATAAQTAQTGTAEAAAAAQAPVIVANKAATQSWLELAASEYMAAHAAIPFAGFGIGAGFTASATALVKGIGATPFADGGIVSGPTLGLVGEYAGAKSNPEVIAPLNKLKEIIGEPASAPVIVGGRIVADGRNLAVVLENYTKISGKSGHRNKF